MPTPHLAWLPSNGIELLGPLPDEVVVAPMPDDPLASPDLTRVEFLVPSFRFDLGAIAPKMSALRVVQTISAGVDSIISSVPDGVVLCSARGAHDVPVAEWCVGAVVAGVREFPFFEREQLAGRWTRRVSPLLAEQTVLLLGYGSIARAVEARLAAFGCELLRVARRPRVGVFGLDDLATLLPRADVVVVLLPLTEATRGLLDAAFLARLPDGALVVNAARGAIVDTDALLAELQSERLRAVLDVTDPEPLPEGHPLYQAPGLLLTPHMAGVTTAGQAPIYALITEQLRRFAVGEPLENVVEAGY